LTFDTGEEGGLQTSPLIVNGVLYGITPRKKSSRCRRPRESPWKFDSGIIRQPDRGLAYRAAAEGKGARILVGVVNFLYALDAATGRPISEFGNAGRIDLRENLGREPASENSIVLSSPGVVFEDLVVVGGRFPETLPAAPGNIRAFDVRTGKLRWTFHTIPLPGEFGYDTSQGTERHVAPLGGTQSPIGTRRHSRHRLRSHRLSGLRFLRHRSRRRRSVCQLPGRS
jgi:quinoprotein glucose dehydrogenase